MRSKIKISIVIFFIMMFGYCIVSNAAISTQSKEVQSGEQFTILVTSNVSLASYSVKAEAYSGLTFVTSTGGTGVGTTSISNALASGGLTSLATFTFKAPEVTKNTTYTIKFAATGMGNENLETVADSNTTATIIVKAPTTNNNNSGSSTGSTTNNNSQTQTPTTSIKSSEARLSNFGIKPNDFSGFKKDKTEYTTEVPNSVAEVDVYADPVDSKATVKGTGKVSLKEGNNTVKVTVTAEDGKTTKTYTLTIKRKTAAEEEKEAGEAKLSQLGIKPEEYDFSGFKSDQTEYSVEVPNEVKEIEVYAKATDSKAQITGTGMIELEEGENELKIEVIAQNGTKQIYTINVIREEAEETVVEEKFGLSKLSIVGLSLTPSFMNNTYEYTVELKEDLSTLEIEATATDKDATVEIIGNENLQEGENTITILVQNEETEESATYQITVNKNLQKEEVIQTSWLKPSTWGKEEKIKLAIIVVLIILIISAIILKIKMAKEKQPKNKLDLPGADELDKAILEHQELADENTTTTDESSINNIDAQESVKEDVGPNEIDKKQLKKTSENYGEQNYIEDIAKNRFGIQNDFEEKPKRRGKHF